MPSALTVLAATFIFPFPYVLLGKRWVGGFFPFFFGLGLYRWDGPFSFDALLLSVLQCGQSSSIIRLFSVPIIYGNTPLQYFLLGVCWKAFFNWGFGGKFYTIFNMPTDAAIATGMALLLMECKYTRATEYLLPRQRFSKNISARSFFVDFGWEGRQA